MSKALKNHWPEYLIEAAGLGLFMIAACLFAVILEYPESPIHPRIDSALLRRVLMGLAMGATAIALIYSPWGKQSGAHMNPAVTLTFYRLGKVSPWDAVFYIGAQFIGGLVGVLLMAAVLQKILAHPSVNYVITTPGTVGPGGAFLTELMISFVLMTAVLIVSNTQRIARFTGLFAGALVATNISLVAPFSGMSMNPARTFASALPAQIWTGLWIYFTAPLLGMLLAAQVYLFVRGAQNIFCAKLHHQNNKRCIFCAFRESRR